ncbi:MAG TPA: 50S ribosomal protein L3 [Candidatus Hydrothermia bacterium]|nr:50S ribosomal protein L3 [Candidatus Hydrothermia bacterium]
MMIGLIGRKLGMTQIPTEDGSMTAVTVIEAGPCTVIQGKTIERDGYNAVKLAFGDVDAKKLTKPRLAELKKILGEREKYPARVIREFRVDDVSKFQLGQEIKAFEIFGEGERIDITGFSKGKGFQGVTKRWGFSGGPKSHGSKFHSRPGSIGQHTDPGRVYKGRKLAGHEGMKRITVKNLQIAKILPEKNVILVKGAIPGPCGTVVCVKKAKERSK